MLHQCENASDSVSYSGFRTNSWIESVGPQVILQVREEDFRPEICKKTQNRIRIMATISCNVNANNATTTQSWFQWLWLHTYSKFHGSIPANQLPRRRKMGWRRSTSNFTYEEKISMLYSCSIFQYGVIKKVERRVKQHCRSAHN